MSKLVDNVASAFELLNRTIAERDELVFHLAARREDLGRLESKYRELDSTTGARIAELEALVDSLERLAVGNVTGCGTCTSVVSRIVTFRKESQSAVPPHLRGPVIQAFADSDGVPPGECEHDWRPEFGHLVCVKCALCKAYEL